jgi:hypothetical protein
MRRRTDTSLRRFIGTYVGGGALIATIISGVFLFLFACHYDDKRDGIKNRMEGMNFVDALKGIDVPHGPGKKTAEAFKKNLPPDALFNRTAILTTLISLKESGLTSSKMDDWIKISETYLQKESESKPSDSKKIKELPRDFYQQWEWSWFWRTAMYIYYLSLITGMLSNLVIKSRDRDERIVDLPWRKPWVWIFITFTLPAGLVFYAVSSVNLAVDIVKTRRRRQGFPENNENYRRPLVLDPIEAAQLTESQREDLQELAIEVMGSEHLEQSRENWKALYGTSRLARWEKQMKLCEERFRNSKEYLVKLGDDIREAQERLAGDQKSFNQTKTLKPPDSIIDDPMPDSEFNRLLSFPRVLAAEISDDRISVWTKPIIFKHNGIGYDLGNYLLEVRDMSYNPRLYVRCIVSGRLDRLCTHLYGGNSEGDFCFGDRNSHIYELLARGEYLGAIDLALQGIAYVNPSGRDALPQFLEVSDEKNPESANAA